MTVHPSTLPDDFWPLLESLVLTGAPTGKEARRADFIEAWLKECGAKKVVHDSIDNVWVDLSDGTQPCRLIDSHTDTVFDDEKPPLRKEDGFWHAPGIGDNTAACALNLLLARKLLASKQPVPLILSFSVGEEGEGDLRGIRQLASTLGERLSDAVILESGLSRCCHQAVGSIRYRIEYLTRGGHSWSDFGQPSALHELSHFLTDLENRFPWRKQHTTMNVGEIHGGATINTIAPYAQATFDFRSVDPAVLARIEAEIPRRLQVLEETAPGLSTRLQTIGFRPAGGIPREHPLVAEAVRYQKELGLATEFKVSSTNANATLAAGIPSICIGVVEEEGIHTRQESIRLDSLPVGWNYLQRFAPMRTERAPSKDQK